MPRMSILLPAYNEEEHIEQAIYSFMNQTVDEIELIVVDDGSTDNTRSIVSKLAAEDSRVRAIYPGRIGKNAAYNLAFQASTSDLFAFFAGDDILPRESVKCRLYALSGIDPRVISACAFGHLKTMSNWKKYDGLVLPKSKHRGARTGGVMTFTRAMATRIFPIPEHLPNEDTWSMLCVEAFAEKIAEIKSIVLIYRIHENNSRRRGISFQMANEEIHRRAEAYDLFIKEKGLEVTSEKLLHMSNRDQLEVLRYNGEALKILSMRGIGFKEKLRAFFHSKQLLYNFKVRFERFFYGH